MPLLALENTSNDMNMRVILSYKLEKSKFVKHCDAIETNFMDINDKKAE